MMEIDVYFLKNIKITTTITYCQEKLRLNHLKNFGIKLDFV